MSVPAHLPWWSPNRRWGFRCSAGDLVVLVAGVVVTIASRDWFPPLAILTPFVLAHFFLFCNVFRVGQAAELVWGGLFLTTVAASRLSDEVRWEFVLLPMCGVTIVLILRTLRRSDYHGAFCQRINPLGYRPEPHCGTD